MHRNIARPPWQATAAGERTRDLTGLVYGTVRALTGWVGAGVDASIARLQPLLDRASTSADGSARDALVAALNGLVGDHLAASGNPLALPMQFRRDGRDLPRADASRMLLLIHGLCMHDAQWRRRGHDHGAALASELGYRPAYLRYNSGLHVAENGRELAAQLERWIGTASEPVTELAVIGYSLGGLVAHSAYHHATRARQRWPQVLRQLVFLGTPHHGAPLERGGHWIDLALGLSRYSAPLAALGRMRSAGITDLRHGALVDPRPSDTSRPRHIALPRSVACAALAASTGRRAGDVRGHLLGDGLVPVASALGQHADPRRTLAIAPERQWIGYGINHLDLLDNVEVYAALRRVLSMPRDADATPAEARRTGRSR